FVHQLAAPHPCLVVVEMAAPGDTGGKAFLERRGARRVIAAHAESHDGNPPGIDIRSRRDRIIRGTGWHLVIVTTGNVAEAQCLALPGAVDRERVDAAIGKLDPSEKDAE